MTDREKIIKDFEYQVRKAHGEGWDFVDVTTEDGFSILKLLKEQEPKTGHWIFESQYCEAWSHKCSECGKRMTTAVNTFANWCWNCGAKMKGSEAGCTDETTQAGVRSES